MISKKIGRLLKRVGRKGGKKAERGKKEKWKKKDKNRGIVESKSLT